MVYRTKTYIAGDWTGDKDAIDTLYKWKNSGYLNFDFVDAHSLTQARDTSLNCSIKRSLKERLDAYKTFVLVVGANTKDLRAGGVVNIATTIAVILILHVASITIVLMFVAI